MSNLIIDLEKLMHLHSPAQVAVWLNLSDPRPIQQWISRGKIPRAKLERVTKLLEKRSNHVRIIRRPARKEKGTV